MEYGMHGAHGRVRSAPTLRGACKWLTQGVLALAIITLLGVHVVLACPPPGCPSSGVPTLTTPLPCETKCITMGQVAAMFLGLPSNVLPNGQCVIQVTALPDVDIGKPSLSRHDFDSDGRVDDEGITYLNNYRGTTLQFGGSGANNLSSQTLTVSGNEIIFEERCTYIPLLSSFSPYLHRARLVFYGFTDAAYPHCGALKSVYINSAVSAWDVSYDGNGRISEFQRTITNGGTTTIDSLLHEYFAAGDNVGALRYVTKRRKVGAGSWTPIHRTEFTRYGASESYGTLGDVKVRIEQEPDGSGGWIDNTARYFRYYKSGDTNGTTGDVKFIVEPDGVKRLLGALSSSSLSDLPTANNTQVGTYASMYYEYDGSHRVTTAAAMAGCGGCGGGGLGGTSTFAYTANGSYGTPSDPRNAWKLKTVQTLPDSNKQTIYTNIYGQVMLALFEDTSVSPTRKWYKFTKYNSVGNIVLQAEPSAITGHDDTKIDLMDNVSSNYTYLADSAGLIHVTDYYTSTSGGINDSTAGGVTDLVQYHKIKQGETGTALKLEELNYFKHTGDGTDVYPVANKIVYPSDSNQSLTITTGYAYTWHSSSTKISQRTTTLPVISTAQNGSNSSNTITEVFDDQGNMTWKRDERGFITRFVYDQVKAVVIQRIDDVDTSAVSDEPSGWATPGTGGLHLVSDFTYDEEGRQTQSLGPAYTVDLSGTGTTVRHASWTVYTQNDFLTDDETWSGQGYATGSSPSYTYTLVDPVRITKSDKEGRTTNSIVSKRSSGSGALASGNTFSQTDWQRWSVTHYNDGGQSDYSRVYHSIPSSGGGSSGTNYNQTSMAYSAYFGRANKSTTPGGTISRTVYDARGRVASTWVGTNDTSATDSDPTGSGASGNNMVKVSEKQYDGGSAGGDGNLTQVTQYVSGTSGDTRVTAYGYDWRNRQTSRDGEVDDYAKTYYDNLDRVVKTERYDTTSVGNLIAKQEVSYDDLGRVYQTDSYAVDPSDGSVGNALTGKNWYDASGYLIKSIAPGAGKVYAKSVYDGLGRAIKTYTGYDTSETSYADAGTVTGDTVLEQTETTYDAAGNATLVKRRQRLHDATGTGELTTIGGSQPKARVSYVASWFDGADRVIASANYGTNADSSLSRPDTVPSRSDTVLVTSMVYNDAGMVYRTTDPAGIETRKTFDQVGRVTSTIENYDDGDPTTGSADKDRTTTYTYTADGRIATLTAKMQAAANADDQVTTYVYGTTLTESGVASIDLLRAVIYPDSDDVASPLGNGTDSTYDRVELTYNRLGQVVTRKDQNGSVHTLSYDKLGRTTLDSVTTLGSGVDGTVRSIARSFEVRGMPSQVTSYDNAVPGSGSPVNDVVLGYNTFSQQIREYQEHSGAKDGSTLYIDYAYASGGSSSNQIRPTGMTYPNGRTVYSLYADAGDTSGVSDVLNRVTALSSNTTRGSSDVNVIAGYTYMGMGTLVRKDYPTPKVMLDYWGGTTGTYAGLDRFGRVTSQNWVNYNSGTVDQFKVNHGYDRDSNRLYADDQVYQGSSLVYNYDSLLRLTTNSTGYINIGKTDIQSHWKGGLGQETWNLDPVGNQTAVGDKGSAAYTQHTANKANEYTSRKVRGDLAKPAMGSDSFTTNTASNWSKPGSGDAFDTNSTAAGRLVVTTVSQDTIDSVSEPAAQAILLMGPDTGVCQAWMTVKFPSGATSGQAGLVFGYKSGADYWLRVFDLASGGSMKVYHVVNGTKTLEDTASVSVAANTDLTLSHAATRGALLLPNAYSFASGYPSGKVGLYTTVANTEFDNFKIYSDAQTRDLAGRWISFTPDQSSAGSQAIDPSTDRLVLERVNSDPAIAVKPIYLKGVRVDRFQATFALRRFNATDAEVRFIFNGKDQDANDFLLLRHGSSATNAVLARSVQGAGQATTVSGTYTSGNYPTFAQGDVAWVRVTCDGTNVTVRFATSEANLAGASDCYTTSAIDIVGGLVGFSCYTDKASVESFTLKADRDANGSYETTEHVENFVLDGSGYANETPTYDKNGNLTYDGVFSYTYDAWNRLVKVAKAYRDGNGDLQSGSIITVNHYDGNNRRIVHTVQNSADLNCIYQDYFSRMWQLLETRNGSSEVLRHHVWGEIYVDELVQVGLNSNPASQDTVDSLHWAGQDSNFNVQGLVDSSGSLVERYEYTPYGERCVFGSSGSNDTSVNSPTLFSVRAVVGGMSQPYKLCDAGHQGLSVDEESTIYCNRARSYHLSIRRFMQRDAIGYISTLSLYGYLTHNPVTEVDPSGFYAQLPAGKPIISTNNPLETLPDPPPGNKPPEYNPDNPDIIDGSKVIFNIPGASVAAYPYCGTYNILSMKNCVDNIKFNGPCIVEQLALAAAGGSICKYLSNKIVGTIPANKVYVVSCASGKKCCNKQKFNGTYGVTVNATNIKLGDTCSVTFTASALITAFGEVGNCY